MIMVNQAIESDRTASITTTTNAISLPDEAEQPRARGHVSVSAKSARGRSVLRNLRQAGSMKLLFPRGHDTSLQAVLVNTAGGITGGDQFIVSASAEPDTELTLTTQAAERAYRAQPGKPGRIRNRLKIAARARLSWLPQETILYNGCALDRNLHVDLAPTGQLLLCETLIFGRIAMGETLTQATLKDRIEITRAGKVIYLDQIKLDGDIAAHMARPMTGGGAGAMASVIYIAPDAEAQLTPVRALLGPKSGASLIGQDLLFIRALAEDSFELRRNLIPILQRLHGASLPRPWMI